MKHLMYPSMVRFDGLAEAVVLMVAETFLEGFYVIGNWFLVTCD